MIKIFASAPRTSLPPVPLPKDDSCLARIQAIWHAIYSFICEWASYLLSFISHSRKEFVANSLSQCGSDPLFKITKYLEPEDVAHLEEVSPAVKAAIGERIWKGQYDFQKVSYMPESGKYKDTFVYPYPEIAFGPKEWVRFLGNPGEDLPRLSTNIHRFLADPKYKEKYVLTFCPATLNGAPFTLNHFRKQLTTPKEGLPVQFSDGLWPQIFKKYGEQPAGKAHWVLMEKEGAERTKGAIPYYMALWGRNYRMGRTLEVAVSVVGALYYPKTRYLLGPHPGIGDIPSNWVFTRTSDPLVVRAGERDDSGRAVTKDASGCVVVGGLQLSNYDPARTHYSLSFLFAQEWDNGRVMQHQDIGIAECFPVTKNL